MSSDYDTTIQVVLDAANSWISEDADRPDPNPEEWEAVIPLLKAAPALADLLRDAQGAMQSLRQQLDQMRDLFPDDDGTIREACDAHDEIDKAIDKALQKPKAPKPLPAPAP